MRGGEALHLAGQAAEHGARHRHVAENAGRRARRRKRLLVPSARARVEQVRGGGVGVFVRHNARKQVVQIFGHHKEAIGRFELLGMLGGKRGQLVDSVEGLALNARRTIERIQANSAIDLGGDRLRARIAIRHGIAHAISA